MLSLTILLLTVAMSEGARSKRELPEYFFIKSQLNGRVIDVNTASGKPVASMVENKDRIFFTHQLFLMNRTSHTIHSGWDNLCLTSTSQFGIFTECSGRREQQWVMTGSKIRSLGDRRVLELCSRASTQLCMSPDYAGNNQLWRFDHMRMFQYFFIKSQVDGLVLEVEGGSHEPGTAITLSTKKSHDMSSLSQLFYEDQIIHTIHSALTDFCLTTTSHDGQSLRLVVENYSGGEDQEWEIDEDIIRSRENGLVLGLDSNTRELSMVPEGQAGVQWTFENIELEYFYIQSKGTELVLDVLNQRSEPGTLVKMHRRRQVMIDNHLWFKTGNGTIRSRLNGYTLDSCFDNIRMYPYREYSRTQGFRLVGDSIINPHNQQCLDIIGETSTDDARLHSQPCNGHSTQSWEIVLYV